MEKYCPAFTKEKWEQIRTDPYYRDMIRTISERAEVQLHTDPPRLKFSDLHVFAVSGERKNYERPFGERQGRLNNFEFMYHLTGEQKYLDALADDIWDLCGLDSWSLPAHVRENLTPEQRRCFLDLVSTALGFRLAELHHFLGDKLPDLVRRRLEHELRVRIIDSYRDNTDLWWMKTENNWASVCAAGVLGTYVYMASKEETDAVLPRLIQTAEGYLRGFDDEGCCKEGYGYWNYGFSNFCTFALLLRAYTDGEIDYFKNPKVYAIAHYQDYVFLNAAGNCIPFSDCNINSAKPSTPFTHLLHSIYPDIAIPPMTKPMSATVRDALNLDPSVANGAFLLPNHIYHETQQFVCHTAPYDLACKAGCNAEFHNHNDVGSFILSKDNALSFVDPGHEEYTRQYFSAERYARPGACSRAHCVPIINGKYQVTGSERSVVVREETFAYGFTMQNAYDDPTLTQLLREFSCSEDGIELTDTFTFSEEPTSVVERFVSFLEPTITADGVLCGNVLLQYDATLFDVSITSENMHYAADNERPLYMTNLTVKHPKKEMSFAFRMV